MSQHYSQPSRESDPYALPDVEVWEDTIYSVACPKCGEFELDGSTVDAISPDVYCPSCERMIPDGENAVTRTDRTGWFYWFCLPGCMPDSEPNGPFATEADALADARAGMDDDDDSVE